MKFLLLLVITSISLFAGERKILKVAWVPDPEAASYIVQVSDTDKFETILLEKKTKSANIELDNEPAYKYARIAGIDKAGVKGEFSDPITVENYLVEVKYTPSGSDFFVRVSDVSWNSSALHNLNEMRNISAINSYIFRGTPAPYNSRIGKDYGSESVRGKAIDIGVNIGSKSGKWRGRFSFRSVSANVSDSFSYNMQANATNLGPFNGSERILTNNPSELDYNNYKPVRMGLLRYTQEYYMFSESPNKYLKGLGVQIGANAQVDQARATQNPTGTAYLGLNYVPVAVPYAVSTIPIPLKSSYYNQSGFANLGFVYRLELGTNHEIEFGANYLKGIGYGKNKNQFIGYYLGLASIPPYLNENITTFHTSIVGSSFNAAYTFKIGEKHGIRLSYEHRHLGYTVTNSKSTMERTINLTMNDFGPLQKFSDKMAFVGLEYFYKF